MPIPEQLDVTRKSNADMVFGLTSTLIEGVEKLAALNMQAARTQLSDLHDLTQQAIAVRDPQEWIALQGSLAAPTAEKMQAWSEQVFDLVAATQAGLARYARTGWDAQIRQARALAGGVASGAPSGTGAALDQAIIATSALYETLQKSGEQAVAFTRSNLEAAAAMASNAAKRASGQQGRTAKR